MEQKCIDLNSSYNDNKTYRVTEVAIILGISERSAYRLCKAAKDFKVLYLGRNIRVHKDSFDKWFSL